MPPSIGFETYPAKWKKPDEELVVLFPDFGKSGRYFTCTLKTHVRDEVYFLAIGRGLSSEPAAVYKKWMVAHDYDPEHGKNNPAGLAPQSQPASAR